MIMNFTTERSSHDIRTYHSGAYFSEIVQTKENTNVRKKLTQYTNLSFWCLFFINSSDKRKHKREKEAHTIYELIILVPIFQK